MSQKVQMWEWDRGVESWVLVGEKRYPATGLPKRGPGELKLLRYYNPNKKKDEMVQVDLSMGEQRMIRHWESNPTKPVYDWFVYALNKGWICKQYIEEPENEFGPVSP
jgi:hypothetical protein